MKTRIRSARYSFLIISAVLIALSGSLLAQPSITSLSFTPASINTAGVSANVTVNFTLSGQGVNYFATAFVDPSGNFIGHQIDKNLTPGNSITDSVTLTFQPFSPPGSYRIAYIFLLDANGFLFLSTPDAVSAAFPALGTLTVNSSVDTTPPDITSLTLTPATIDTTVAPADLTVGFTLTDNLAGANFFQIVLTSPSGNSTLSGSKSLTAATSVTDSATVTFPRFGEAGTWTITNVFISDAANNTLILSTADLAARSFPTTVNVTSGPPDTTPPTLTALSFTPTSINVTGFPATVTLSFQMTDDIAGATDFQAVFLSPSGVFVNASSHFAATTSKTGTATATFAKGSENGTWTLASVFLGDAAGNTSILATSDLTTLGFPTTLNVVNAVGDTTPPVIVPTVTPAPNAFAWNTTTPVTVSWSVTDPESGINSSTGCGNGTVSGETTGMTFTCSATNNAGLTASVSVTVRIDLTAPIVTPSVSPSPNVAGWNNTDTTVSWSLTDSISGIDSDSGCGVITLTAETAGTSVTCMATNGAGLSRSVTVVVKIDKTPPSAVAVASPAPNGAGWNNTNVTVSFAGADALSGIAGCTAPITISTEGAGQAASGVCTDNAGNVSATATAGGIKIDKTPPIVVPTVSPAPNAAGWNNTTPVTVSWSVTEPTPGSSVTSSTGCTTSTVTAETAGTTFTCTATNIAGLTTTVSVTVKIDKTPPVTTATPAPGTLPPFVPLATVNATAVVKTTSGVTLGTINITCFDTLGLFVNLHAVDNGSGVASLTYAATGAGAFASTTVNGASAGPSIGANGLTTLTFAAKDVAGNTEATKSESVLVGRADNTVGFACAAPTPTFVIPEHGKLVVAGTITSGGITLPFNQTITF